MRDYTGRLLPFRPLIAAMLLAGQNCRQIADLLHAGWITEIPGEWNTACSKDSTVALVHILDAKWSGTWRSRSQRRSARRSKVETPVDWVDVIAGRA